MFNERSYQSVKHIGDSIAALDSNGVLMLVSAVCGILLAKVVLAMIAYFGVKLLWRGTKGAGSLLARAGRWFYAWRQPVYGQVCQAVLEEMATDEEAKWEPKNHVLDAGTVQIVMSDNATSVLRVTTGADNVRDVTRNMNEPELTAIAHAARETIKRVIKRDSESYDRQTLTTMGHRDRWDRAFPDEAKKCG